MFTRIVELTSESGKAKELANTINEKVLPILKKQRGFVDETVLVSDTEPTRVLGLSFWNTKEDAERYHQEQYPKIHEMPLARDRAQYPDIQRPHLDHTPDRRRQSRLKTNPDRTRASRTRLA